MRIGVVYYPGSNCEQDVVYACRQAGMEAETIWHKDPSVEGFDGVVISGGFSYGDYLRCGAIAKMSPVMPALERFAADGGLVLGICNGFQVLVESGLLPGALLANNSLQFRCQDTPMRVERNDTPYTNACETGQVLRMNMAHYEGNYFADEETLDALEQEGRVVLRFCDPEGEADPRFNPNGSARDIAAICNEGGNILGLMPHPERSLMASLGPTDGRLMFDSLRNAIEAPPSGAQVAPEPAHA